MTIYQKRHVKDLVLRLEGWTSAPTVMVPRGHNSVPKRLRRWGVPKRAFYRVLFLVYGQSGSRDSWQGKQGKAIFLMYFNFIHVSQPFRVLKGLNHFLPSDLAFPIR